MTTLTSLFASASLAALAVVAPATACAQAASPPAAGGTVDEVVVTGSRINVNGNSAPTPLTIVGLEQLKSAAPTTVADALAQVPQFRNSTRPSSFITPQASTGAFLSLRGLGPNRTLVLFDGRRTTPTSPQGTTDINTFPEQLLRRVDIVTGGASAAYGSDAVSGVVNFVLDDSFTGLKGEFGGGVSSRSDDQSQKAGLAAGTEFMGGRGHVVASFDYYNSLGITHDENRPWNHEQVDIIPNPTFATDGRTANLWRAGVTASAMTEGGVITGGPLKGTQFLTNGAPAPFVYGAEVSTATMVGGGGIWSERGNIATPLKNLNAFAHFKYDLADDVTAFAEASWGQSKSTFTGTVPNYNGTNAITIFADNAYLPASIKSQMEAAKLASIPLGRLSTDWGRSQAYSDTETARAAAGFQYESHGWTVDGAVDYGRTNAKIGFTNGINQINVFNGIDSVISPTTGQPVCRSTLTNPGNGCVPLNVLGPNAASAAALNYIHEEGGSELHLSQTGLTLSIRGEPFSLWAGPVNVGAGIDYHKTTFEQISDPLSQVSITQAPGAKGMPPSLVGKLGVFFVGNQSSQPKKSIDVKEYFAEAFVPLVKDKFLVKSLDLSAAIRYADYSSTGGVTSWKVGLTYRPTDEVRFRATRSRDVRAPNITELYSPLTVSLGPIKDPVTGTNNNIPNYFGGNPDLKPELADTTTVGVVYQPAWIPGFSASLDYYSISIDQAVGTLGGLNILNFCAAGQTYYCQFVQRLPDKTLVSITQPSLNLNRLETDGVDFEANYSAPLSRFADSLPGQITARALVSYLHKLTTTDPYGTTRDQAGVNGGETVGTPHWQGSLQLTYTLDQLSVFVQERYIGSGKYSDNYVEGGRAKNSIDYNQIPEVTYTDVTVTYKFGPEDRYSLYATVNNLFDKDPPPAPSRVGAPVSIINTNPTLYDVVGRYYSAGLRFRF